MVNSFQTGEEFALLQAAHARDHLLVTGVCAHSPVQLSRKRGYGSA